MDPGRGYAAKGHQERTLKNLTGDARGSRKTRGKSKRRKHASLAKEKKPTAKEKKKKETNVGERTKKKSGKKDVKKKRRRKGLNRTKKRKAGEETGYSKGKNWTKNCSCALIKENAGQGGGKRGKKNSEKEGWTKRGVGGGGGETDRGGRIGRGETWKRDGGAKKKIANERYKKRGGKKKKSGKAFVWGKRGGERNLGTGITRGREETNGGSKKRNRAGKNAAQKDTKKANVSEGAGEKGGSVKNLGGKTLKKKP